MNRSFDGGPAFPIQENGLAGSLPAHEGMSLRDYFAAKALQGLLADTNFDQSPEGTAPIAYRYADAMLAARAAALDPSSTVKHPAPPRVAQVCGRILPTNVRCGAPIPCLHHGREFAEENMP